MFSIFSFACGATHLMAIWIVWNGHYGYQGVIKALTAIASVATALMLYPYMPRIVSLRSAEELALLNTALEHEMDERERTERQRLMLQGELAHKSRLSSMG